MSTPNSASPNVAGSAAFLPNDRDAHDRAPEMELFSRKKKAPQFSKKRQQIELFGDNLSLGNSHGRKPRSNFRRPSSLGLAATPLASKTETKGSFQPKAAGRSHIVAPLKDHLKPEGGFEKTTEVKSNYRNLSPARPVCNKIKDHLKPEEALLESVSEKKSAFVDFRPDRPMIYRLSDTLKPEGDFAKTSEMHNQFKDVHAQRPHIHRLRDHSAEVQPEGKMESSTESGAYKKISKGGEIVQPGWVSNFEKVTIS